MRQKAGIPQVCKSKKKKKEQNAEETDDNETAQVDWTDPDEWDKKAGKEWEKKDFDTFRPSVGDEAADTKKKSRQDGSMACGETFSKADFSLSGTYGGSKASSMKSATLNEWRQNLSQYSEDRAGSPGIRENDSFRDNLHNSFHHGETDALGFGIDDNDLDDKGHLIAQLPTGDESRAIRDHSDDGQQLVSQSYLHYSQTYPDWPVLSGSIADSCNSSIGPSSVTRIKKKRRRRRRRRREKSLVGNCDQPDTDAYVTTDGEEEEDDGVKSFWHMSQGKDGDCYQGSWSSHSVQTDFVSLASDVTEFGMSVHKADDHVHQSKIIAHGVPDRTYFVPVGSEGVQMTSNEIDDILDLLDRQEVEEVPPVVVYNSSFISDASLRSDASLLDHASRKSEYSITGEATSASSKATEVWKSD